MQNPTSLIRIFLGACLATAALTGCSGSSEDVRVSFCKNLSQALQPAGHKIDWTSNENQFRRPEYAITKLRYEVTDADGERTLMRSGCHFEHESLDDSVLDLADPLSAYATLPFKMTVNGEALPDAELLRLVNAEQRRLGRAVVDQLNQGAKDAADAVRSAVSR